VIGVTTVQDLRLHMLSIRCRHPRLGGRVIQRRRGGHGFRAHILASFALTYTLLVMISHVLANGVTYGELGGD
jgi:hypothetical protein